MLRCMTNKALFTEKGRDEQFPVAKQQEVIGLVIYWSAMVIASRINEKICLLWQYYTYNGYIYISMIGYE